MKTQRGKHENADKLVTQDSGNFCASFSVCFNQCSP